MILAIHQPDYIPYPGYFYKIAHSDCFVFLDDAQFSNEGFSHWNRIKSPGGELRLKIPVKQTLGDKINEVLTKDTLGWKEKHISLLRQNYSKARFFDEILTDYKQLLHPEYQTIADLNIAIIMKISEKLGIATRFERSSTLELKAKKEERVIDLCTQFGAQVYLSGNGAKVYQKEEHFTSRGVALQYSKYQPITYEQLWGEFIPNLSILDYLFHYGYDWDSIEEKVEQAWKC
ncbi:MAG: hypothetical protein K0S47_410 [Herbinix sp.]|jgi:hypothetical protein|nr:hypothetical protein [Herbinix sp.]